MAIWTIVSMVQFFGCPSVFFTFAPDDIHSVLTLRMSCPTKCGNHHFPSVNGGFEKNLQERNHNSKNTFRIKFTSYVNNNPVAAAHVFKITLEAIFEILVGIVPNYLSKFLEGVRVYLVQQKQHIQ